VDKPVDQFTMALEKFRRAADFLKLTW